MLHCLPCQFFTIVFGVYLSTIWWNNSLSFSALRSIKQASKNSSKCCWWFRREEIRNADMVLRKQCSIHILNDEILSFETKTTQTGKAPELKRSHWLRMPDSNWFPKLNFPLVGTNGEYFVDQLTHLDSM